MIEGEGSQGAVGARGARGWSDHFDWSQSGHGVVHVLIPTESNPTWPKTVERCCTTHVPHRSKAELDLNWRRGHLNRRSMKMQRHAIHTLFCTCAQNSEDASSHHIRHKNRSASNWPAKSALLHHSIWQT